MLRASGALDIFCNLLSPVFKLLGIPSGCSPLALLRPFSGSGAIALGSDIIKEFGADSYTGRVAAVMLGASETTFYVITVYFGSLKLTKTGKAVSAALIADAVGFITAALTVRLFFGV